LACLYRGLLVPWCLVLTVEIVLFSLVMITGEWVVSELAFILLMMALLVLHCFQGLTARLGNRLRC
jgi:hypothetical protein